MTSFLKKLFFVIVGGKYGSQLGEEHEYRKLSDEELVKIIVEKNNSLLFGILYDRYATKIYNKCIGFAKSEPEALDLTQDVFLTIFIKLGSFKEKSKFSSWVYSVTYNFCINYVTRDKGKKIKDKSSSLENEDYKLADEVQDSSLFELRSAKLEKALELIDPEDRKILLLKYQDDVPVKELCALLDVGESAVKMRLKRAKSRTLETYNSLP